MKLKNRFFKKTATSPMVVKSEESVYCTQFMQEPDVKANTGKLVYVRKEYHERILRIIQVIGKNDTSIYGFLDNIIAEHFALHKDEITALYDKSYKSIF